MVRILSLFHPADVKPLFWDTTRAQQSWKPPKRATRRFHRHAEEEGEVSDDAGESVAIQFHRRSTRSILVSDAKVTAQTDHPDISTGSSGLWVNSGTVLSKQTIGPSYTRRLKAALAEFQTSHVDASVATDKASASFAGDALGSESATAKKEAASAQLDAYIASKLSVGAEGSNEVSTVNQTMFDPVNLVNWEDGIVWDGPEDGSDAGVDEDARASDGETAEIKSLDLQPYYRAHNDSDVDSLMRNITWDADTNLSIVPVRLDRTDHRLTLKNATYHHNSHLGHTDGTDDEDEDFVEKAVQERTRNKRRAGQPDHHAVREMLLAPTRFLDPFNLSNDHIYADSAAQKGNAKATRATSGAASIRHALPAVTLQEPCFHVTPTIQECRNFHRMRQRFPLGREMKLLPPIEPEDAEGKKHKKEQIDPDDAALRITDAKDLTARDQSDLILFEYSEEVPPIVQREGMDTLMKCFYRKRAEKDAHVPQCNDGTVVVLEPTEKSPFSAFGDVDPGETVTAVCNNLFVAPIYRQRPSLSDFVVVRRISRDKETLHLKPIPRMYTVGQTLPLQEVPGPSTRRLTNYLRNRIVLAAYRSFAQLGKTDGPARLFFQSFAKQLPLLPDAAIIKRLKEISNRHTDTSTKKDMVFYMLKKEVPMPTEESLRQLMTPEQSCLLESYLVAYEELKDADPRRGRLNDEEEEPDRDTDAALDAELAPWNMTKNAIQASEVSASGMIVLWH